MQAKAVKRRPEATSVRERSRLKSRGLIRMSNVGEHHPSGPTESHQPRPAAERDRSLRRLLGLKSLATVLGDVDESHAASLPIPCGMSQRPAHHPRRKLAKMLLGKMLRVKPPSRSLGFWGWLRE